MVTFGGEWLPSGTFVRGMLELRGSASAALLDISEKGVYELARRRSLPTLAYWGKMALFDEQVVLAAARKRGLVRSSMARIGLCCAQNGDAVHLLRGTSRSPGAAAQAEWR